MSLDNYKKFLGQKIHVKMDRKMGERHPKYNFFVLINRRSFYFFNYDCLTTERRSFGGGQIKVVV